MNRFSVLYLLNGQYQHLGSNTRSEAQSLLHNLSIDKRRIPIGIYDAKTELFEWEPTRQADYVQGGFEEQGRWDEQIITIAQALRRRDSSWHPATGFQRPSFFA